MFWDLFDKIINAVKPGEQSHQPPEQSDQSDQSDQSQSWPEGQSHQDEASQEPTPDWQETPATHQDEQQP